MLPLSDFQPPQGSVSIAFSHVIHDGSLEPLRKWMATEAHSRLPTPTLSIWVASKEVRGREQGMRDVHSQASSRSSWPWRNLVAWALVAPGEDSESGSAGKRPSRAS